MTTLIWHFVVLVGSSAILLTGVALFVALAFGLVNTLS